MKLTYFDIRGRAEAIRCILAAAGVEYEDKRLAPGEWLELKSKLTWGQVPVLETDDGTILAQSMTICRYLGKKYNLAGSSEMDAAKCDEIADAFKDLIEEFVDFIFLETNEEIKVEKQKKFVEVSCPSFYKTLNGILKANGGPFILGNQLSWTDIVISCGIDAVERTVDPNVIQAYPEVMKMHNAVQNNPKIKAWIIKRPSTKKSSIQSFLQNL